MLEVRIFAEATYKDISDDAKIQLRPVSFEVSKRCTKEETIAKYQAKAEADWESALDEHPMGQDIDSLAVIMQVNPARGYEDVDYNLEEECLVLSKLSPTDCLRTMSDYLRSVTKNVPSSDIQVSWLGSQPALLRERCKLLAAQANLLLTGEQNGPVDPRLVTMCTNHGLDKCLSITPNVVVDRSAAAARILLPNHPTLKLYNNTRPARGFLLNREQDADAVSTYLVAGCLFSAAVFSRMGLAPFCAAYRTKVEELSQPPVAATPSDKPKVKRVIKKAVKRV
jgi:hypothetical protein